jgi:hypothetical protein
MKAIGILIPVLVIDGLTAAWFTRPVQLPNVAVSHQKDPVAQEMTEAWLIWLVWSKRTGVVGETTGESWRYPVAKSVEKTTMTMSRRASPRRLPAVAVVLRPERVPAIR